MKEFMRLLSTLTVVLCFEIIVKAEPVSPDIARQTAQQFLQARGLELQKETMRAPQRSISTNNNADYYVFTQLPELLPHAEVRDTPRTATSQCQPDSTFHCTLLSTNSLISL